MRRKKVDPVSKPKPFKLAENPEITEREALKFDVPSGRAAVIATEVDAEGEGAVVVTETRKESELRDVFKEIYDEEVARRELCPVDGCLQRLKTIEQAIAHMRVHLLFEADWRSIRAVAKDIETQIFPAVEQAVTAALTPDDRAKLVKAISERRKLLESRGN